MLGKKIGETKNIINNAKRVGGDLIIFSYNVRGLNSRHKWDKIFSYLKHNYKSTVYTKHTLHQKLRNIFTVTGVRIAT